MSTASVILITVNMIPQSVYVILVNWNGWKDTIECLESLFRSTHSEFKVIICDNNSTDGSVDQIVRWAAGDVPPPASANPALRHLSYPPVPKPLPMGRLRATAGNLRVSGSSTRLTLIENSSNLGFASANNIGMRYALSQQDVKFLWLLNNDTVVNPDALEELVKCIESNPETGILGSKLIFYHNERQVQALGGAKFNRWTARGRNLGAHTDSNRRPSVVEVCAAMDYVVGASMFVPVHFVKETGFLNEEYFLYFEELDWALRSKGRFRLSFCDESIVYHKGSASTHRGVPSKPSLVADYFSTRNKLSITRRYYPMCLPTVYAYLLIRALRRVAQGAHRNAYVIARLVLGLEKLSHDEALKKWIGGAS